MEIVNRFIKFALRSLQNTYDAARQKGKYKNWVWKKAFYSLPDLIFVIK